MPIRISKTEHEYPYGHRRKAGERFDVDQKDVPILLALGRIEQDDVSQTMRSSVSDQSSQYETRAMVSDSPREKRSYNRKAA